MSRPTSGGKTTWLAFSCACRDMEVSCDETVVKDLGDGIQADYSASLLRLATGRRILAGTPLAFGEGDTKGRIKHLLNYRKPAFWLILTALAAALVLGFVLISNPVSTNSYLGARYVVGEISYEQPSFSFSYDTGFTPSYILTEDGELYAREWDTEWTYAGTLVETERDAQDLNALFEPSNNHVQRLMDDVATVYEAQWQVSGPKQQLFYYLLEHKPLFGKTSTLYLAVGHSREQMRWLFALETPDAGIDLEYLEFAMAHSEPTAKNLRCFSIYEDEAQPGWLLAGYTAEGEVGVMEVTYQDDQHRRTYRVQIGMCMRTPGGSGSITSPFFVGKKGFDTEYEVCIGLDASPYLTVEKVPYTLADRLRRIGNVLFAADSAPSEAPDTPADTAEDASFLPLSTAPVYDLSSSSALLLSRDQLSEHQLWTNSTEITVTVTQAEGDVTLWLCDAETGNRLLTQTLAEGGQTSFTNLTASSRYYLEAEGQPNTMLSITD